ncbi:MAG: hypothetical protein IH602_16080 [Bryobacteraceae bacterium]|nr:hypothetical protein [Bryobacteraceae bacterium]
MTEHCTTSGKRIRTYGRKHVAVSITQYPRNGRTCLRLIEVENGEETGVCTACTVNLPRISLAEDEVAIQTWSKSVGILEWLIDQEIVSKPLHYADFGGTFIPICNLLVSDDRVQ